MVQSPPVVNGQWVYLPSTRTQLSYVDHTNCTVEGLCDPTMLKSILNDYLEFIYPLIPVVHRPSFRQDIEQGRGFHVDGDPRDNDFVGLVVAICAAVVGILPSRFETYRSMDPPIPFQNRADMINYCSGILTRLRGPKYFDEISHQKWATSYLMYIAFFQYGEHNRARMVEVEAMQLARLLDLHQISRYDGLNCIETQLRKKAFWLMFYGYVYVYHYSF